MVVKPILKTYPEPNWVLSMMVTAFKVLSRFFLTGSGIEDDS